MSIVAAERCYYSFFSKGPHVWKYLLLFRAFFLESLRNLCILRHKRKKREVNSFYSMSKASSSGTIFPPKVTTEVFYWEPLVSETAIKPSHFCNCLLFPGSHHVVILKPLNGNCCHHLRSFCNPSKSSVAPSAARLFTILHQQSHEWQS